MSVLSSRGLTVRKNGKTIVEDISLSFGAGEFVAVVGANGAGKTTLLDALAGLSRPDPGEVLLDGRPLPAVDRRTLARRRAYLPQTPRAEWPISVERLIALGLTPHLPAFGGLSPDMDSKVQAMIEACDLAEHREQPATTLSGGELARAMLARALVGDPDILIADEPVAGLDPRHALDTLVRLRGLADRGKLVVATLHDLTLVARYATRVTAIHHGRVVADGPTAATLTPAMLLHVFDVEACVSGEGEGAYVDFVAPAPKSAGRNDRRG